MKQKYFRFPVYFWEAAQSLSQKDRRAFYSAVIEYAFTGELPTLSGKAAYCFNLAKFHLDKSNKNRAEKEA